MKFDYLNVVKQRIKDKTTQNQICAELEGHIQDKTEYYKELGYSDEEAEKRAVEDMGEPDDAALPLMALHKKTGSSVLMCITFAYVILVLFVELTVTAFRYSSGYTNISGTREGMPHSILIDFLSFAIVAGFVVLLYLAYRKKSISVPLIIAVFLIIMLSGELLLYLLIDIFEVIAPEYYEAIGYSMLSTPFSNQVIEFVPCSVFQPFMFAAFKIATAGFGGYTGSVLSSSYLDEQLKNMCRTGSIIVCFVLIGWAVFQLVLVIAQIHMKRTKTGNKIMYVFIRVIAGILALYLAVIVVCTGVAALNRPNEKTNVLNEKTSMIEDVVFCSPYELTAEEMLAKGYNEYSPGKADEIDLFFGTESYFYKTDSNNLIIIDPRDEFTSFFQVKFRTSQESEPLTEEEYDLINSEKAATLGDFLALGFYNRASEVTHVQSYSKDMEEYHYQEGDMIEFCIPYQENGYNSIICMFSADYYTLDSRPDIKDFKFERCAPFGNEEELLDIYSNEID